MKRAAPSEEPQAVSSSSDSDQEAGKRKGGSVPKAAAAAEDGKKGLLREEPQDLSSDGSLSSDSDDEAGKGNGWNTFALPNSSKASSAAEAMSKKKKTGGVDFSALSRHGYRGGPSVLTVRPQEESNWSWSTGKDRDVKQDAPESFEERERTRAAVTEGEKLIGVQNAPLNPLLLEKDHKNASFSQKEKRRRGTGDRPAEGRTMSRRRSGS